MKAILRVDDFPGTKTKEFDKHNLENFKKFNEVLVNWKVPYTLGVIPGHTTDEQLMWLEIQDNINVALHGINHDERFQNEFQFDTEPETYRKIYDAQAMFLKCNGYSGITEYIPPHNFIDYKTVNALSANNFKRIFGGPGSDADVLKWANQKGIDTLYSDHPLIYGRSDEMMNRDDSVNEIHKRYSQEKFFAITLHWPWEFNIGLESMNKFISKIHGVFR